MRCHFTRTMKYQNVEVNFARIFDDLNVHDDINVLVVPNIRFFSDATEGQSAKFQKVRLLVARQLTYVGDASLYETAITRVVGDKLESVEKNAFCNSYFLEEINLKKVGNIGRSAFSSCNIKLVKNDLISELVKNQFEYNSGMDLIKMRRLRKIQQRTFQYCPIQKFDAPYLEEIVENEENLQIAENNFQTRNGVAAIPKYKDHERDFEQMIQRLPAECFQTETVTLEKSELFEVDNCLLFPPNTNCINAYAYSDRLCLIQVFGASVEAVGDSAFLNCFHLRKASFPNATYVGSWSFASCEQLTSFVAPKCTQLGEHAFWMCKNLKHFVAQPKILRQNLFERAGLEFLDLPSVESALEKDTFQNSLVQRVRLPNCRLLADGALDNCYALGGRVRMGCADPSYQLFQLEQIIGLITQRDGTIKMKIRLCAE